MKLLTTSILMHEFCKKMTYPLNYDIFTFDTYINSYTIVATYAADTAILSVDTNPITASQNLQEHTSEIDIWSKKFKTKINENKADHIRFAFKEKPNVPIL